MPTNKPKSGKRVAGLATLIQKYYADLADLSRQKVMFEMVTRFAFHALMHGEGKRYG